MQAKWCVTWNIQPRCRSNTFQGLGIALVAAQKAKVPVTLVDTSQASLDKGLKFAGTLGFSLVYFNRLELSDMALDNR